MTLALARSVGSPTTERRRRVCLRPACVPPRDLRLFLCGDVMTGRGVDQILPHPSSPELFESWIRDARDYVGLAEEVSGPIRRPVGFEYVWGDALRTLRDDACAAVRVANLETSVTRDGEPWPGKGIHYRMHPDNVACLTAARIDVAVLGNNHALDWGRAGLLETLAALHRAGIATAGAGATAAQASAPALVEVGGGGRVVVVALGATCSGVAPSWAATADEPGLPVLERCSLDEAARLAERAARARRPGDVVVASLHWGSNWGDEVEPEHVRFAHALVEGGVDIVHGHSSHHARPLEVHAGKLVLYGCGDLVNDYEGIGGHEAFRPELVLAYLPRIDVATGRLLELRMLPFRTRRMRLERASRDDAAWLARRLTLTSARFETRVVVGEDGALMLAS